MKTEFVPSYIESLSELKKFGIDSVAVAIGVFDGVHKGHAKLLHELQKMAISLSAYPVAMTFFPHPRSVLFPDNAPLLLLPPNEKLRLICRNGAKAVVTLPFTKEFAALSPEDFLQQCLFGHSVEVKGICVGHDWKFGSMGKGDRLFLEKKAAEKGFLFKAVDELRKEDGKVVSSTAIRESIAKGELSEAEKMLGRPYRFYGVVEKGYQVAGKELATPTANLKLQYGVLPPLGVYAAKVEVDKKNYPAAMNVGIAPTFEERYGKIDPRIELHLLTPPEESLYGKYISAELVSFIRQERKFDSPALLKEQIGKDIQEIRQAIAEKEKN